MAPKHLRSAAASIMARARSVRRRTVPDDAAQAAMHRALAGSAPSRKSAISLRHAARDDLAVPLAGDDQVPVARRVRARDVRHRPAASPDPPRPTGEASAPRSQGRVQVGIDRTLGPELADLDERIQLIRTLVGLLDPLPLGVPHMKKTAHPRCRPRCSACRSPADRDTCRAIMKVCAAIGAARPRAA